ncbi:hypothetical protein [Frankia sp. ACN1ag]|uniref:hypothetical protein n=1 Tax=Frankia sp. ACN1ag TaxID=102891 RepID=UPI00128F8B28|nr:hypothetical protein [Frankia sp. ACN1ag]
MAGSASSRDLRSPSARAARPASVRAAASASARPPAARRGPAEPISLGRLIGWGLAASVAFLVFFALLGAFGVLAFGALAGLWALGVAWIMIFGPPTFDRRVVHTYSQAARASLGDAGSVALTFLRSSRRSLGSSVRSARRPARPQRAGQSTRAAGAASATRPTPAGQATSAGRATPAGQATSAGQATKTGRATKEKLAARTAGGFGAASVVRATRRWPADRSERAAASGGRADRPGASG